MALNPMARPFVPEGGETTAATSSNNCSSSRIRGGVGHHQQQTTESTNVIGSNESNNNATLQESPPRNKSTPPSADSSRSTICQQNGGNNNRQQGNNNRQLQLFLAPANNNANNENTEQNRTQPLPSNNDVQFNTEEPLVSTGRDPLQQIDNPNNVGTVSSAVYTFGRGLRNAATLVFNQFPFGGWGLSVGAKSDIQHSNNNVVRRRGKRLKRFQTGSISSIDNNDDATYQSPLRSKRQIAPPAAPSRRRVRIRRRRIPAGASLQGTGFDDKRKRTKQVVSNGDNVVDNGAKRTKRTSGVERVEVDTTDYITALVCILSFGMLLYGT